MMNWVRLLLGIGGVLTICIALGLHKAARPADLSKSSIADLRGEATDCAVHSRILEEDVLGVFYGYIDYDNPIEGDASAAADRFPHAMAGVADGSEADGKSYARVRFCPDCRLAEEEWVAERGNVPLNQVSD